MASDRHAITCRHCGALLGRINRGDRNARRGVATRIVTAAPGVRRSMIAAGHWLTGQPVMLWPAAFFVWGFVDSPLDTIGQETGFRWTAQRKRAALLLAEDEMSDAEIAETLGIARSTLSTWKVRPEFAAQVGDYVGELQSRMLRYRIAKKRERVKTLDVLHAKLLTVIEERAEEGMAAPGAGTGLIVRQLKMIGAGRDAEMVEEFAVDNGTIRQIMAIEEQAAKELGQWVEKQQYEDITRVVEIVGVDAEAI